MGAVNGTPTPHLPLSGVAVDREAVTSPEWRRAAVSAEERGEWQFAAACYYRARTAADRPPVDGPDMDEVAERRCLTVWLNQRCP